MASKVCVFFIVGLMMVSGEALVILHWVMHSVSHRHTAMAIEIAHDAGAFVRRHRLFQLL